MLLFKEQIDKREEKEKQHLQEAVEQLIGESGLHSRQAGRAFSQGQAIQCILETLGVPGPIELDEEEFFAILKELNDTSKLEDQDIRPIVKKLVPTYHYKE